MLLSKRCRQITTSATMKASAEAKKLIREGHDIIKLDLGEPDFDTPLHIKAAGMEAIQEGHTRYTPAQGNHETLCAIQQKLKKINHLDYKTEEITVTPGAKHALYCAMMALIDTDDEVIVPVPYWPSYIDMIKLCNGSVKKIKSTMASQFKITAEQIKKAITHKTRAIILNSPNNPSGAVYDRYELEDIAKVLLEHPHITIITDDVYEHIHMDESKPEMITNVAPNLKKQTLSIFSLSKAHAMTGWRIGYAAGPEKIIQAMIKIQSQIMGSSSSIAQRAAVDALSKLSQASLLDMGQKYRSRHTYACSKLSNIKGLDFVPAHGAFYIFINAEKAIHSLNLKDDIELCQAFLHKAHVSCVPGTAFGLPMHFRLSFCTRKTLIHEGLERIEKYLTNALLHKESDENIA